MSKWQSSDQRAITVTITMPQWQADALRAIAKEYGLSLSETVRAPAVEHWMQKAPDAWKHPSQSRRNDPVSRPVIDPTPDTVGASCEATGGQTTVSEIDYADLMGSE